MGNTSIEQPSPPAQPSTAQAINAWVKSMPQVYETQMKYAPLEAQQQVELAQQYAGPLGEAYLEAQKAMYPQMYDIEGQLAGQVKEGMQGGVPDWMRQEYLSNMRAQVGENALAGSGADYISRGLLQQNEDWRRYYQNMGLSMTNKQPVATAQQPQTSNYMVGYTPGANMNYMSSTYSPYASAYSSMYGTNAQMSQFNAAQPFMYLQGAGNLMQGMSGQGSGFMGWD